MKKAFLMSILLHVVIVVAFIGLTTYVFRETKEDLPLQLSMEILGDPNVGKGNVAKGVEDSESNIDANQDANSAKNSKKVEKKTEPVKDKPKPKPKEKPKPKPKQVADKDAFKEKIEEEKELDKDKKEEKEKPKEEPKEEKKKEEKVAKKDNATEKESEEEQARVAAMLAARGKAQGGGIGNTQTEGRGRSYGGLEGVFSLKEVDDKPKLIKRVNPTYPEYAYNMRIEGSVRVMFAVDEDGNVVSPKVVKANPPDTFENAAITAVRQWKFKPAKKNGKIVNVRMVAPINFVIKE